MDLLQIITISGIAFIVAAAITSYFLNKKKTTTLTQLPYSAAITKDVLDQIAEQIETPQSEVPAKPKKKRKYYPKKPKTSI
jgi:hypothetical protein